jgi:hypothetical protein
MCAARVGLQPPHRPGGLDDLEQVGVRGCIRHSVLGHASSPLEIRDVANRSQSSSTLDVGDRFFEIRALRFFAGFLEDILTRF